MATHETSPEKAPDVPPDLRRIALHNRIENDMALRKPATPQDGEILDAIRSKYIDLAHVIVDFTPVSREQSLALTDLEQSLAWAIGAVVRHPGE